MLNRLVELSLRYKFLVLIIFAVVAFLGLRAVRDVPIDAFPDVTPAQVNIYTESPGLAAEDVELLPGTHIAGSTTVARGARIGPQTTLLDCEVGEDAVITRTDATLAVIGERATVGPFAYLRPNTQLGADGKIGTFVETKNSQIGAGSKVPHLSYLGDTTVGEGSNIGAGTITANYDGEKKHPTTVGSHVRTGSHNVFVAPVTIGDGAYSGAGTVIRKDVPAGALAILQAPQRNVERWVAANRPGSAAAEAAARAQAEEGSANQPDAGSLD